MKSKKIDKDILTQKRDNKKIIKQFRLETYLVRAMRKKALRLRCSQTDIVKSALKSALSGDL